MSSNKDENKVWIQKVLENMAHKKSGLGLFNSAKRRLLGDIIYVWHEI